MLAVTRYADAFTRFLMSLLFLISGGGKLVAVAVTQDYMRSYGIPGALIWPAATFEIASGLLLIAGLWLRPLSFLLVGWCLLTAAIFHTAFADQIQQMMFFKNITMAGGFLLLARAGAPVRLDGVRVPHGTSREIAP